MEEMTEKEALYILRKSYVMTTNHCLDEENIKLKKAIRKILQINKHRNARNKQLREKNKNIKQNYISKQTIEDKINELENNICGNDLYLGEKQSMKLVLLRQIKQDLLGE